METKVKEVVEQVSDRQLEREAAIDERFAKIEDQLSKQPTLEDFNAAMKRFDEGMARLNNYVHNFMLGVQILEKGGKFAFYAVVTIGSVAGGIFAIKSGFILLLAHFGFIHVK